MDDANIAKLLSDYKISNAEAVVAAVKQPDRPTLARALGMLENETGGRNVYGDEGLAAPWLRELPVTQANYTVYKDERERLKREGITLGVDNGVGCCQLTELDDQLDAQKRGGCWIPLHNMEVGFAILHQLILAHGVWGGYQEYNGGSELNTQDESYANIALERATIWQARLEHYGT